MIGRQMPGVDRDVVGELREQRGPCLADHGRLGAVDERVGLGAAAELRASSRRPRRSAAHWTSWSSSTPRRVVLDPVLALVRRRRGARRCAGARLCSDSSLLDSLSAWKRSRPMSRRARLQAFRCPALLAAIMLRMSLRTVPGQADVRGDEVLPSPGRCGRCGRCASPGSAAPRRRSRSALGREAGDRRAADVEHVLVDVAPADEPVLVEERHDDADVALVDRARGVRVVAHEGVARARSSSIGVLRSTASTPSTAVEMWNVTKPEKPSCSTLASRMQVLKSFASVTTGEPEVRIERDRHLVGDVADRLAVDLDVDQVVRRPRWLGALMFSSSGHTVRAKLEYSSRVAGRAVGT